MTDELMSEIKAPKTGCDIGNGDVQAHQWASKRRGQGVADLGLGSNTSCCAR